MEVDDSENEDCGANCIVCNDKCSVVDRDNENRTRFRLAYGLFCKLLLNYHVASSGGSYGGEGRKELLWNFVEECASMPVSSSSSSSCGHGGGDEDDERRVMACEGCAGALQEILRLERIIEDLRVSQMTHVNTLKRSVLRLTPAIWNQDKNYWKQIQCQLISCLQEQHTESVKPTTRRSLRRATGSALNLNRNRRDSVPKAGKNQSDLEAPPPPSIPSPKQISVKPCSVFLTRLTPEEIARTIPSAPPLQPASSPSPISAPPGRATRQSKLRAYDFLKKNLTASLPEDDDGVTSDQEDYQDYQDDDQVDDFNGVNYHEDENDLNDLDFCPSPTEIKEEPENSDSGGEESVPENMDLEWTMQSEVNNQIKTKGTTRPAGIRLRVQLIAPNIYLYNCSIIKFCPDECHFTCQDPGCSTPIPGTFLDGSLLENMRTHVQKKHNSIIVSDRKTRLCPICSKRIFGPPKKFRKHIMTSHVLLQGKRKVGGKGCQIIVCDICGKDTFKTKEVIHKWSHRNLEDKIVAIQNGEAFPAVLKQGLRRSDPLYSVVFGEDPENYKGCESEEENPKVTLRRTVFNKHGMRVQKVRKCSRQRSKIPQLKRTSTFSIVYRLEANAYCYQYTCLRYSAEERQYICQEEGCGMKIGDWEAGAILKIKEHVDKRHACNKGTSLEMAKRPCPLCGENLQGLLNFRNHLIKSHTDPNMKKLGVICEVCSKPILTSAYLCHVWSHKSDEDALNAICVGEAVSTEWKKTLMNTKMEPHYSLLFLNMSSEHVGNENSAIKVEKEDLELGCSEDYLDMELNMKCEWDPPQLKSKSKLKTPKRMTTSSQQEWRVTRVQFLCHDVYLFNCTVIKFCSEDRHFICQEPDCSTVIDGTFLDGSIQDNIRSHVREKHHTSTLKSDGKIRSCPLCSTEVPGSPKQFRQHIMNTHVPYKSATHLLCDTCGKESIKPYDVHHKWSHRSFHEKVEAIQRGEIFPTKLKEELKRRKDRDPLYSVVFGKEDGVKGMETGAENDNLEMWEETFKWEENEQEMIPTSKGRARSEIVQTKRTSVFSILYRLEGNIYLNKYTCLRYSQDKRVFSCEEEGCSAEFPGWEQDVVGRIKEHVDREHFGNTDHSQLEDVLRPCPLCPFHADGVVSYRAHLIKSHSDKVLKKILAICEICLKPLRTSIYLTHIWSHKSDEDALAAIQAGEAVSTEWKKALKERKTEPQYSLIFSSSGEEKVGKESSESDERKEKAVNGSTTSSRKTKLRNRTSNLFYSIDDNHLLYKCTFITVADNRSRLICNEPGCDMSFHESPMNYFELFDQVKRHVEGCHEKYYRKAQESSQQCPVCDKLVNGGLELRDHYFKEHNDRWRENDRVGGLTICQSCWKPVLRDNHNTHSWTHKNSKERGEFQTKKVVPHILPAFPKKLRLKDKVSVSCKTCGKIFSSLMRLKVHLPMHEEKRKKCTCHICGKELLWASVRNHMERVHQPESKKWRQCQEPGCGKMFNRKDFTKFKIHMRRHRGEKPFVCDLCGGSFHSNSSFKQHYQRVHGPRKYQCEQCGESYKCPGHLRRHKKNTHKQQ